MRDKIAEIIGKNYNRGSGVFMITLDEIADEILALEVGKKLCESECKHCSGFWRIEGERPPSCTRPMTIGDAIL